MGSMCLLFYNQRKPSTPVINCLILLVDFKLELCPVRERGRNIPESRPLMGRLGAPYFIYHSTFNPHHDPNKLYSIVELQYLLVRDVETYIKEALHDWNDRGKDFRHGWIREFQCCHKTLFLSLSISWLYCPLSLFPS